MSSEPRPSSLRISGSALVTWLGRALTIGAIVFVAVQLAVLWDQIELGDRGFAISTAIAGLALVYAAANVLLGIGWALIVKSGARATDPPVAMSRLVIIAARAQLAKYVPGNVFQFVSRQALGARAGLSHQTLAWSQILEIVFLCGAAVSCAIVCLPVFFEGFPQIGAAAAALFCGVTASCIIYVVRDGRAAGAFLLYFSFFGVLASIFVACFWLVGAHDTAVDSIALGGSFIASWLAGFVVPGAPAGVGVREAALLALMNASDQKAALLTAVLIARFVTVFGDVLFFIAGAMASGSPTRASSDHT